MTLDLAPETDEADGTHVECRVCSSTYLPHLLSCPTCGILRSESKDVAAIRRDLVAAGFIPLPPPSPFPFPRT